MPIHYAHIFVQMFDLSQDGLLPCASRGLKFLSNNLYASILSIFGYIVFFDSHKTLLR